MFSPSVLCLVLYSSTTSTLMLVTTVQMREVRLSSLHSILGKLGKVQK
jgi:hypothetical protein